MADKKHFFSIEKLMLTLAAVFMMSLVLVYPANAAPLGQVTGLKQNVGNEEFQSSINVKWNSVKGNNIKYRVELSKNPKFPNSSTTEINETDTNYYCIDINYLCSGSTYYIRVKAVSGVGDDSVEGAYSKTLEVVTAPAGEMKISQTKSTETSVTIQWKKVSGANMYEVRYGKKRLQVTGTKVTLKKLPKNKRQHIQVYPGRKTSNGSVKAIGGSCIPKEVLVRPAKMKNDSVDSYFVQDSPKIRFDLSDRNLLCFADGFQWQLYSTNSGKDKQIKTGTIKAAFHFTITNKELKKKGFFKIRIRAYIAGSNKQKIYGAWSDWKYICRPPKTRLDISDGILLSWDKIKGVDRYTVYMSEGVPFPWLEYKKIGSTKNTSMRITKWRNKKLEAEKDYNMYVVAEKKIGKKYYPVAKGERKSICITKWY